jgi:hypothetical protein
MVTVSSAHHTTQRGPAGPRCAVFDRQRRLCDVFHLELRYNGLTSELGLRVTIAADTATALGATVHAVLGTPEAGILPQPPMIPLRILCVPGAGHAEHPKRLSDHDGQASS